MCNTCKRPAVLLVTIALLLMYLTTLPLVTAQEDIPGERVSFRKLSTSPPGSNGSYSQPSLQRFNLEGESVFEQVLTFRSLGHFDRERIPERVVHAKGSTFYGVFRLTNGELGRYTKASIFNGVLGKETPLAARFSTSLGERGSPDTAFGEVRGLGVKFYTEEGNYDLLCINLPVFFINDPQLFPQLTHAQKRDPKSDFRSADNLWDFFSLRPETLNMVTWLYSNHGLPDGYRNMPAFSVNAFKLTNHQDSHVYVKFIWLPQQGIRTLNLSRAIQLAGEDSDYSRRDLFNAIARKRFPTWTLFIQVVTIEQVHTEFTYNPFDATKLWPLDKYPLIEVGTMTLTSNVANSFAENEQIALNPANLIPGIEVSPDRLLRGRLFSYRDTQFYRLGANHALLSVNREPIKILSERDGAAQPDYNLGDLPNYYPNSYFLERPDKYGIAAEPFAFPMEDVVMLRPDSLQQQYAHARESFRSLNDYEREQLAMNLAFTLSDVRKRLILERVFDHLYQISPRYEGAVREEMRRLGRSILI